MQNEYESIIISDYEKKQLDKIDNYKNEVPSVMSNAVGIAFKPVEWLTEKIIPEAAIRGALDFSNEAAKFLTDENDIKRDAGVESIEELKHMNLELCDKLADDVHNWAIGIAVAEGGVTGALGLPGMMADIPTIITFALRTINKIGICYGYRAKSEMDNQFVLSILSASSANSLKEKESALLALKNIETVLIKQTWKAMAEKAAQNQVSKEAAIITVKNLAKQLGINITKRKALQAIPVIGAGVGASVNGWYIKEIGWCARRMFQERWLRENGKILLNELND